MLQAKPQPFPSHGGVVEDRGGKKPGPAERRACVKA